MLEPSLLNFLRLAENVVVLTGAGMSAESGIPTFRDRFEGLWAKYDPMDVATPAAFRSNPQFVWDWHVQLAEAIRRARPNAGHSAVADLQQQIERVTVITQNIDNLHQDAGSAKVIELHGNLFRLKAFVDEDAAFSDGRSPAICAVCNGYAVHEQCDPYADKEDLVSVSLVAGPVPQCPGCGAHMRPDVVWFGEALDPQLLQEAWHAVERCDALICVGTSLEVEPAASLPWHALNHGAMVIEVNPVPTTLSTEATASILGGAATVLPELFNSAWGK